MLLGCCSGADWRVDCCSCNSDAVPNPVAHPPMHAWYPGLPTSSGTGPGFVKISVAKDSDTILGATIVAPHAGDMISELTTCIQFGVGAAQLAGVMHPYPTTQEAVRQCAAQYNKNFKTDAIKAALKLIGDNAAAKQGK